MRSLLEEDNLEATAGMEALGGLTEEDIYRESGYDVAATSKEEEKREGRNEGPGAMMVGSVRFECRRKR